jgi:hypothetical protein
MCGFKAKISGFLAIKPCGLCFLAIQSGHAKA